MKLRAHLLGTGRPIVVLHRGLGHDHQYLRPWMDWLADHGQVAYLDLRGHGCSGGRETLSRVTHATFADDVAQVCKQLADDRVMLVGHSYGGFLALEVALRHPHVLQGLVLCATSASLQHAPAALEAVQSRSTAEEFSTLLGAFSAPIASDEEYGRVWRTIAPLYFSDRLHPALNAFTKHATQRRLSIEGSSRFCPNTMCAVK